MGALESQSRLLSDEEGAPVAVLNPRGSAPIVLVCEHASPFIPSSLGMLGLADEFTMSHAVWDPGALALAERLSARFDAPLVAARVSRLVYDCNRPPTSPDAMPARSEVVDVPGNRALSAAARAARVAEIYEPFRTTLAAVIAERLGTRPAVVTIHTFTPVWFGSPRTTELGLLHDTDDRLARAMLAAASRFTGLRAELNRPYGPQDGVTHTLRDQALPHGLLNVMIEVRNDKVATEAAQDTVARELGDLIEHGLASCHHGAGDRDGGSA